MVTLNNLVLPHFQAAMLVKQSFAAVTLVVAIAGAVSTKFNQADSLR